jgi:nitrite reductase/ring-hydroxylating ferredoxin subunit
MDWIKVFASGVDARKRLLESKPQLLIVHDRRICLVLRNDQFLAVEDSCPHNGESLSKGNINYLGEVICPLHGYRFQLRTGRETEERCRDLKIYPTKEDETGIYIGM